MPSDIVVRLSVVQIVDRQYFGDTLLEVEEPTTVAAERARAWALVRGYDRLIESIEPLFAAEPAAAGFHGLINKPTVLLVYVTWPWVEDRRRDPRSIAW